MIKSEINPSYKSYETALLTFINTIMTGKGGLKRDRKGFLIKQRGTERYLVWQTRFRHVPIDLTG